MGLEERRLVGDDGGEVDDLHDSSNLLCSGARLTLEMDWFEDLS